MILTEYTEAAEFVRNNDTLSWDGWNIVRDVQDDYAEYLPTGFFKREEGKWYKRVTFPLEADGWSIPDSYARTVARK